MSATGRTKVGVRWNKSGLERQMDFYGKESGNSVMTVTDGGVILPNPSGGVDYYVDGNSGDDTKTGRGGFGNAMKTLTVALAASHASIADSPLGTSWGFAARNRIFAKADAFTENLVLLAQKTDIYGVGSYNQWMKCGLVGTHVPISATGIGVRFYNFHFIAGGAGANIMTLDATQRGIEFHNCTFDAYSPVAGSAIVATAVWFLRIINCDFVGQYSDAVIEILSGNTQGLEIAGNYIEGANEGIGLATGVTSSPRKALISDNTMHVATRVINDVDGIAAVTRNHMHTTQARGTMATDTIVINVDLATDNWVSMSDHNNVAYPVIGAAA